MFYFFLGATLFSRCFLRSAGSSLFKIKLLLKLFCFIGGKRYRLSIIPHNDWRIGLACFFNYFEGYLLKCYLDFEKHRTCSFFMVREILIYHCYFLLCAKDIKLNKLGSTISTLPSISHEINLGTSWEPS